MVDVVGNNDCQFDRLCKQKSNLISKRINKMCTENYHWHHDYVRLAWDSGFCFDLSKSKSNFDWSSIGLVDIDRVSRDRDIAAVEKHIPTVLHFTLDEDQTRILDPTFVKVFRLSQLSVQYLQFCKRYLDNTVVLLKKQLSKTNSENSHLNHTCEELETEIKDLKKKVKELKIQPESGGSSLKCNECAKIFVTEEFLVAHVKRRHSENPIQKETDKLQMEIKELKERLNSAEKYVQNDHNLTFFPNNDVTKDDYRVDLLQNKFDQLKDHVEKELNLLRDQKQYQEKYDKWFELVFQRLENSQRELLDKGKSKEENNVYIKENSTQTDTEVAVIVKEVVDLPEESKTEEKVEVSDLNLVQKIQEDIRINTENHLDQIQDRLQEKLTGGLEQIQSQMNNFWQKINELQIQQPSPKLVEIQAPENDKNTVAIPSAKQLDEPPKPAPRVAKTAEPAPRVAKTAEPVITTVMTKIKKEQPHKIEQMSKPKPKKYLQQAKPKINKRHDQSTDEDSDKVELQIKPSNTSTLAQKSIASLQNLLTDADVQQGLKEELEQMVNLRLKEIGVSPHWSRLPDRSYTKALTVIKHRSEILAKTNPEVMNIQRDILDKIEGKLQLVGAKTKTKVNKSLEGGRNLSKQNHQKITVKRNIENLRPDFAANKLQTPTKKKVNFDLETSSTASSQHRNEAAPNKVLSLTKQNIELLVAQPRTVFKSLDTSSAASSVLDVSQTQNPSSSNKGTKTKASDDVSDWEDISDIL